MAPGFLSGHFPISFSSLFNLYLSPTQSFIQCPTTPPVKIPQGKTTLFLSPLSFFFHSFTQSEMGYCHNYFSSHRRRHLIISLLFLLVSCSTQVRFMAEGRANFKLVEVAQMGSEEKALVTSQIGSRPPRCERRCSSCGHCEAVQVPAVPQEKSGNRHSSMISTIAFSRGEDSSNYKPMSWKCKCGDMIFNP